MDQVQRRQGSPSIVVIKDAVKRQPQSIGAVDCLLLVCHHGIDDLRGRNVTHQTHALKLLRQKCASPRCGAARAPHSHPHAAAV
eukprot:scaffold1541_cov256-Pinguiococcus_pyrenoidosus.AAC.47